MREAVGFDILGSERFHHLMAADGLLQDLIELGGVILRAAGGAADAASDAQGGHQDKGQHGEADEGEPPVLLNDDAQQEEHGERLAQPIGQHVRSGHLDFFDIVHDGRHYAAGGVGFEEVRVLPQHAIEHRLAQVGDGGESDVVDEIVAEVVAQRPS